jgi:hypothetical protein
MKKFTDEGIKVWLRFAHEGESALELGARRSATVAAQADELFFRSQLVRELSF